jgi:DeoR/GlpR family transcriptional regulator of sugar metabolism
MVDILQNENGIITAERQRLLLERIERDGRISLAQAAIEFATLEDTIRRDLRELADANLVERVHASALQKSLLFHRFGTRLIQNPIEKARLAAHALSFLRRGMVVLLDQSTSNLSLARQIPSSLGLTVVTPSPDIAMAALDRGISELVLVDGRLDPQSRSSSGALAMEQIGRIRPDLCFLGACTIDITAGITAMDYDDACLKRAMVAASASVVALITADKLDTGSAFAVAPLTSLDHMVTQSRISEDLQQRYGNGGVEIHLV